jgi:single-stranded-DNA-specific exonuclease
MRYQCWKETLASDEAVCAIAGALKLPVPLARVLVSRGIAASSEAERFLANSLTDLGDYADLPDMEKALDRIRKAVRSHEKILIFGDYDVDGVTASAILCRILRGLGCETDVFIPDRLKDGYGMSAACLTGCLANKKPDLIITVDCGTGSFDAVKAAQSAGVDVIITDHHEAAGGVAPALAVVNPKAHGKDDFRELSGAGLSWSLCRALLGRMTDAVEMELELAALGTVCDVVPLNGQNRILVARGMEKLAKTSRPGLVALKECAGLTDKELECHHLSFGLGPRINAAGRMGDARIALDLLLTDDPGEAVKLARTLEKMNEKRKTAEDRISSMARDQAAVMAREKVGIVVGGEGWHTGIIGIVASRLVQELGRAVAVVSKQENGQGRGSCRGIEGIDVVAALARCSEHLDAFGGHKAAAGFTMKAGHGKEFRAAFEAACLEQAGGRMPERTRSFDAWVSGGEIDMDFYGKQLQLKPFGVGNPTPVFGLSRVRVLGEPRVLKGRHLKMNVGAGNTTFETIGFDLGVEKVPDGPIDILFKLQKNEYMGRTGIQLQLVDLRASV